MSEEEIEDVRKQLDDLLTKVQPDLQDVIKRSFTNVAIQQSKNGEKIDRNILEDTSYFAKNTQVNLTSLELLKSPSFHMQSASLDLKSMMLSLRCSLGEVSVKGLYSAFNENLYNLIPVLSEGHVVISLSNVTADASVGLALHEDAFSPINPGLHFSHDEVLVKLSWPSPQKDGGYEFVTTEQLAKHVDDLPLTAALAMPLFALLQQRLQRHLATVLRRAASVSDLVGCSPSLLEAYREMASELAARGNRAVDLALMGARRSLLQGRREALALPPLHATFLHKIGTTSYVGRFEAGAGWLRNLATVARVGDASVWREDSGAVGVGATLAITHLEIGYDEYRVRTAGAAGGGRLAATFARCELRLALRAGLARGEPYGQLHDLRAVRLDGMDLHVTGLGGLSGAAAPAAWARGAGGASAPGVAAQLRRELRAALAALPLWELLQPPLTTT